MLGVGCSGPNDPRRRLVGKAPCPRPACPRPAMAPAPARRNQQVLPQMPRKALQDWMRPALRVHRLGHARVEALAFWAPRLAQAEERARVDKAGALGDPGCPSLSVSICVHLWLHGVVAASRASPTFHPRKVNTAGFTPPGFAMVQTPAQLGAGERAPQKAGA